MQTAALDKCVFSPITQSQRLPDAASCQIGEQRPLLESVPEFQREQSLFMPVPRMNRLEKKIHSVWWDLRMCIHETFLIRHSRHLQKPFAGTLSRFPKGVLSSAILWPNWGTFRRAVCDGLASLIAQLVKNPPGMQETSVRFLGREDPLEKG